MAAAAAETCMERVYAGAVGPVEVEAASDPLTHEDEGALAARGTLGCTTSQGGSMPIWAEA